MDELIRNLEQAVFPKGGPKRGHARTRAKLKAFRDRMPAHLHATGLELVGSIAQTAPVQAKSLLEWLPDLARILPLGGHIRLCKGAYDEPDAVAWRHPAEVNASFDQLLDELMRAENVFPAVATHDEAIIDWTKRHASRNDIPRDTFEFQMLYGIRRDLQRALVDEGYSVRIYVPYGRQWYPYYMRRMAEQPQNIIWVTQGVLRESLPH